MENYLINRYFNVKIAVERPTTLEDGKTVDATSVQEYLIKTLTFGHAEKFAYKLAEEDGAKAADIKSIKPVAYNDIFYGDNKSEDDEDDEFRWYAAKVKQEEETESGKTKVVSYNYLIDAGSIDQATEALRKRLDYCNFKIAKLTRTNITKVSDFIIKKND